MSIFNLLAMGTAVLLLPAATLADGMESTIDDLISPTLVVKSNGSTYHSVDGLGNLVAEVRVVVDTGDVGRVASWRTWLQLHSSTGTISYEPYAVSDSYPAFGRPTGVNLIESVVVPSAAWATFAKGECNTLANALREQGLGDTAIFAEDRTVEAQVSADMSADTTGAGSGNILQEGLVREDIDIRCSKWAGTVIPQASDDLQIPDPQVTAHQFAIQELYGPSGMCMLKLHGEIRTDRSDTEVRFRYRDREGHLSQVWTVDTGANKTASFTHQYPIANDPDGGESGSVRMVGVSHTFRSAWEDYTMECVAAATNALVISEPPQVTMTAVPQGEVSVLGQICPERLKLVGRLQGRGDFSGHAGFVGEGWYSPGQVYEVSSGETVLLGADYRLHWSKNQAPGPGQPLRQAPALGLNATNENQVVIASAAKKPFPVACSLPMVNQAVKPAGLRSTRSRPASTPPRAERAPTPAGRSVPGPATIQAIPKATLAPAASSPEAPKARQERKKRQRRKRLRNGGA